jgi:hypothetical protein
MGTAYCTLFDSYYLSRGLVMIRSLQAFLHPKDKVYVFCFDSKTLEVLNTLQLSQVIPISLTELETPELLAVKPSRTKGEYCWTSTPQVLLHVLKKRGESECTYLDADLCFYENPKLALPKKSVLITEHRYTPQYDQTEIAGRFCVQFVTFKNEPSAMKLLEEWGKLCLDWCYNRVEAGKFGDQKYLDAWPMKGDFVEISENRFVGVAPWNIQQYTAENFRPVFYHFHGLQQYADHSFFLGGYPVQKWAVDFLYGPYLKKLTNTEKELEALGVSKSRSALKGSVLKRVLKRMILRARYVNVD